jgi:multisubunit Na+/H+ antiporter MnhB subunit
MYWVLGAGCWVLGAEYYQITKQQNNQITNNILMKGMTVIVKKTTQLIAGLIFMYGIYIIVHGHLTPGGGFAGGIVLAGSFILLILAYGSDFLKLIKEETGSTMYENLAILMVIFLSLSGLLFGAHIFFLNWLPKGTAGELISAGMLPLYNIFVGIEVAASILTIFLALIIFKEEISK